MVYISHKVCFKSDPKPDQDGSLSESRTEYNKAQQLGSKHTQPRHTAKKNAVSFCWEKQDTCVSCD